MKTTTNLGLQIPDPNDTVDIVSKDTHNMDTLDTQVFSLVQSIADLFGSTSVVLSGGVASKDGTTASQLDVTAATVYFSSGYRVTFPAGNFATLTANATYYLDYNPDGTTSFAMTHSSITGYVTIAQVTTDGSGNISAVTDERPTTVNLLANALSILLPSLVKIGTTTSLYQADNGATVEESMQNLNLIAAANPQLVSNAFRQNGQWSYMNSANAAGILALENDGSDVNAVISVANGGSIPNWAAYKLARVLSGGYKIQSGSGSITITTAGTEVTAPITFPIAFTSTPKVKLTITALGVSSATYVTLQGYASATGITVHANSGVAQAINFDWEGTGD